MLKGLKLTNPKDLTLKKRIYVQTQFESIHRCPEASAEAEFLRHPHRHLFYCRVEFDVRTDDRDKEFFLLQRKVRDAVKNLQRDPRDVADWSCERWAYELSMRLGAAMVEVSEDGENGAYVEWVPV